MSREFITKEIDKIYKKNSESLAMCSAWIMGNFKAINLKVLKMTSENAIADYFVLCSVSNMTQANAIADEISMQLKRLGETINSKEGMKTSDWILLDTGDIIIHIFMEAARPAYAIEDLWLKAESLPIPQEYYFSSDEAEAAEKINDDDRDFF